MKRNLKKYIMHDGCDKGCGYIDERDLKYVSPVEAIPKDQYEARLKADLVAMLTEIQLEIEELNTPPAYQDEDYFLIGTNKCSELIQQKIDKCKIESEEYINFADDLIPIINEAESEVVCQN